MIKVLGALLKVPLDEEAEFAETVETEVLKVLGALFELALDEEGPELVDMLLETAEVVETLEIGPGGALDKVLEMPLGVLLEAVELAKTLDTLLEILLIRVEILELVETLDELLEVPLDEEGSELLDVLLETVELAKTLDTLLEILLIKVETLELGETVDELLVKDDDELEAELGPGSRIVLLADGDVAMLGVGVGPAGIRTVACTNHVNLLIIPRSS